MSDPVICFNKVSFSYGGPNVLQDISVDVAKGDFMGLIGPNGGGKSTLLKLALGLLKPDEGTVTTLGKPPEQGRIGVGYVPQFISFPRDFPISVQETVLMGTLGWDKSFGGYGRSDKEASMVALEKVEATDLASKPISALSGGQLQRVLIARALVCQPKILMLDEPTSNIDMKVEKDIFELLLSLHEEMTIMVVSHDIGFISQYVTHVTCLNQTLVCHNTAEVSQEVIDNLYGGPVDLVDHTSHHHHHHSHDHRLDK